MENPAPLSFYFLAEAAPRELAEDIHDLARVFARMQSAVRRRDAHKAGCYLLAARGLAYAAVAPSEWKKVNLACFTIEADLDNELWASAARSVDSFFDVVDAATRATSSRN